MAPDWGCKTQPFLEPLGLLSCSQAINMGINCCLLSDAQRHVLGACSARRAWLSQGHRRGGAACRLWPPDEGAMLGLRSGCRARGLGTAGSRHAVGRACKVRQVKCWPASLDPPLRLLRPVPCVARAAACQQLLAPPAALAGEEAVAAAAALRAAAEAVLAAPALAALRPAAAADVAADVAAAGQADPVTAARELVSGD
jgi:hypothetical protein